MHRFQQGDNYPLVLQHWNRHLDLVPAYTPIMETGYVEKAEVPTDRHVLPWRIVRFPFMDWRRMTDGA